MQVPPPEWPIAPQTTSGPRERGILLGAFLILGIFGNVVMCAMDLLAGAAASGAAKDAAGSFDTDTASLASHSSKTLHFLALVALCNVVFLTGAWMWKRWGVYGYFCFMLFGALIGMKTSPVASVVGLMWGAVIAAIVAPKWKHFE